MDSNNNDTEIPEDQPEEQALQLDVKGFACRAKAKADPQRRKFAGNSSSIIPMNAKNWIDIEPLCVRGLEESGPFSSTFSTSTSRRRRSGSFLENERKSSESITTNFSLVCLAAGGGAKWRYQHCTDVSGIIVYLRDLQGHSGRNFIDLSLQDNVVGDSERIFPS